MVVSQMALMYGSFPRRLDSADDSEFEQSLVMLAVQGDEDRAKIAPWLKAPSSGEQPRAFILEDVATNKYGVASSEQANVTSLLSYEICKTELDAQTSHCRDQQELTKCSTCSASDGVWYSAVSLAGNALAHTQADSSVVVSHSPTHYRQIDIVASTSNEDFLNRLSKTLTQFKSQSFNGKSNADMVIRLLLSPGSASTPTLDGVSHVLTNSNLPHACSSNDCLVISLQDSLTVSTAFLRNAMSFVQPLASIYFPVSKSVGDDEWRANDYETFALAGSDATLLKATSDPSFFTKSQQERHIVRMQEAGLTYHTATKEATSTATTKEETSAPEVIKKETAAPTEIVENKPVSPARSVEVKPGENQPQQSIVKLRGSAAMFAKSEKAAANAPPTSQLVRPGRKGRRGRKNNRNAEAAPAAAPVADIILDDPAILIAVSTSRKDFATRVSTIQQTWGANLPPHVVIGFFIGQKDGKAASTETLAQQAGLEDAYSIIVVDAPDNHEVKKGVAILQEANKLVTDSRKYGETNSIGWLYQVHDDSYVNIAALTELAKSSDAATPLYLGKRGQRPGVTQPYCEGGVGFLMSHTALSVTAPSMKTCVSDIDANSEKEWRKSVWHSDSVIGLCTFLQAGIGCGNDHDEDKFVHMDKISDLQTLKEKVEQGEGGKFISVHPLMDGHMEAMHKSLELGAPKAAARATMAKVAAVKSSPADTATTSKAASPDNNNNNNGKKKKGQGRRAFNKQLESLTTPDGAMEIPKSLVLAAEVYPEFKDRLYKIRRWRMLGQERVVERLIKKSLQRLTERGGI